MINLKVMLIEEDKTLNKRLADVFSAQIQEVRNYQEGFKAIADFQDYVPDLIMADIKIFNLVDLEMISAIKKTFYKTRIIITYSSSETDLLQKAVQFNIDHFIMKPINIDKLLQTINDIASEIHLQADLSEKNMLLDQYKQIVDQSAYITITDKSGKIKYVNDKFCELSGYSRKELIGSSQNIVRDPNVSKKFFKNLWKTILNKQIWTGVIKNRRKNGTVFYVETTISPILDSAGDIKEFISIKVDITNMVLSKKQLERDVITDRLTDLPNRLNLKTKLKGCSPQNQIMLINIDRFKAVNMLFGIYCGDNMLIYLAQTLQQITPSKDFKFFRIAADEFIVLYEGKEKNALRKYLDTLKKHIQANPFEFQGVTFDIDFTSIIMQCLDAGSTSIENLQKAMNNAKNSYKEIMFYEDINNNDDEIYKHNFKWLKKIKSAINENRLELFFQPLYDIKKQKITKYESLIRLIEPDGRVITPDFFLQAAKLSKSYRDLTKIVIKQACEKSLHVDTNFSINLSIEDLADEETLLFLIESVEQYNLQHRLIIEVLESEGIDNFNLIMTAFTKLKKAGLKIAIDDFGSGYSNFSYLVNLPIDILKIDGSLIKNIATDINSRIIVQYIVMFAHELGIKCIAEFVSNQEIFEIIKVLGVDIAQGYYIAPPSRDTDVQLPPEL